MTVSTATPTSDQKMTPGLSNRLAARPRIHAGIRLSSSASTMPVPTARLGGGVPDGGAGKLDASDRHGVERARKKHLATVDRETDHDRPLVGITWIPQRVTAADDWNRDEVARWRGGGHGPFQRIGTPGIVARDPP